MQLYFSQKPSHTVELHIVCPTPPVEDLNTELSLCQTRCIQPHYSQDSFKDLPPDHCRLGEATAEDEDIAS